MRGEPSSALTKRNAQPPSAHLPPRPVPTALPPLCIPRTRAHRLRSPARSPPAHTVQGHRPQSSGLHLLRARSVPRPCRGMRRLGALLAVASIFGLQCQAALQQAAFHVQPDSAVVARDRRNPVSAVRLPVLAPLPTRPAPVIPTSPKLAQQPTRMLLTCAQTTNPLRMYARLASTPCTTSPGQPPPKTSW